MKVYMCKVIAFLGFWLHYKVHILNKVAETDWEAFRHCIAGVEVSRH